MKVAFSFLIVLSLAVFSLEKIDPNFWIFLCFGQSNMEGQGDIEQQDREGISERFRMMAAVDMPQQKRKQGIWYKAEPPLCREWNKIGPTDYFGRTMVENLPEDITIGVINVAVGGCAIELFDEDKAEAYLETTEDWLKDIAASYGNHPYRVLMDRAKEAQQVGVIKGILLHQGESNTGDVNWPKNVKLVYDRMIEELNLDPEKVPLLVGEVVTKEQGGLCDAQNAIIAKVPSVIPNSYVISAKDCTSKGDGYHFNTAGYRVLGRRYAEQMLEVLNKQEQN